MGIKDRDVRDALETLDTEFENLEAVIKDKDNEIDELTKENTGLKEQVEEYENRIKELEEALAEAYLTSEANNEIEGKLDSILSGQGINVSNSTDNETTNS